MLNTCIPDIHMYVEYRISYQDRHLSAKGINISAECIICAPDKTRSNCWLDVNKVKIRSVKTITAGNRTHDRGYKTITVCAASNHNSV